MLDDWWDRAGDAINHPTRPLPQGRIEPNTARNAGLAIFAASQALAATLDPAAFVFVAANNLAFGLYTPLKRVSKIAGNAAIVYWNLWPWLFSGYALPKDVAMSGLEAWLSAVAASGSGGGSSTAASCAGAISASSALSELDPRLGLACAVLWWPMLFMVPPTVIREITFGACSGTSAPPPSAAHSQRRWALSYGCDRGLGQACAW